jgi:hypothetical protein
MTRNEFYQIVGYFANPSRNTRIEIEAKRNTITKYVPVYQTLSGNQFPIGNDTVYVLDDTADKWGREMRLYFTAGDINAIPPIIDNLKTGGGRPGYDLWNYRLNHRDIIDDLFSVGFSLQYPQDFNQIQSKVASSDLPAFNLGFNAP